MRPSASSRMVTTSAIDSRQGSSLLWCSYGPTNTTGRSSSRDVLAEPVAIVELGGDAEAEDVHQLVDGAAVIPDPRR